MTDKTKMEQGNRGVLWMSRLLGGVAVTLLFAMMILTFIDVVGRYFFNFPVPGGFEITEIMMATLIFAGLPLMTISREHITVDLFDRFTPSGISHIRDAVISLICALSMGTITWRMWVKAGEAVEYGDVTAFLYIPMGPPTYFMCVMSGLTAVVFLFHAAMFLFQKHPTADT
jgi:TRAP-type C4-dicarboxylate transport system permease small subunit